MDVLFLEGVAAVVSAIILFIGSIWLLLTLVMGARLAYFVIASVTLGFLFIMTLVWSFGTPLGPVGQLPDWEPVALEEQAARVEFGPATAYPEGDWREPDDEDAAEVTKAAELESAALNYLADAIQEDAGQAFLAEADATVVADSARLLTQGEDEFGALTLEASDSAIEKAKQADPDQQVTPEDATAVVVMKYDPGNPLGKARTIAAGTFVFFALHLFGLSLAERKTREAPAPA